MHDLISQIEDAAGGSVAEEVRLLKERRESLDDVIKLSLGINDLQKSLESVLLLKQPPKDIPRDLLNVLGNISNTVANLPSNELSKRLDLIEKTIQHDIDTIMGISSQMEILDSNKLGETESQLSTTKLRELVTDFRRRTNTAIILKLHLRKRGANVSESVIPVSTDVLVEQVSKLVIEEKKCRARTIKCLTDLDEEIGDLIINPKHPETIKLYAVMLHDQINQNIGHLKQGKDIEKMPFAVEIIEVGKSKEDIQDQNESIKETKAKIKHQNINNKPAVSKTENKKPSGFFTKLFKWFSSSWSIRWRDL